MDPWWRDRLQNLYEEIDCRVTQAGPRCEASGKCCRFRDYGHTLFLSEPEAEYLLEPGLPQETVVDSGRCPYQINGLCTARDRRPAACRTFFCDPSFEEAMVELTEESVRRLKGWHRESGRDWCYRPLSHFLGGNSAPNTGGCLPVLNELA